MPHGIAIKLGLAPADQFQPGSELYRLWPSLGMADDDGSHVVVAYTSGAIDTGLPETTVFKVDTDGNPSLYGGLDGGAEALSPERRIVGRYDPDAALANLANAGYLVVAEEDLPDLEPLAIAAAKGFAKSELHLDDKSALNYALLNWGMFAARNLVFSGDRPAPVQSTNSVHWMH